MQKTNEPVIRTILHLLAWLLLLGLPIYASKRFQLGNDFLLTSYTFVIIGGLIFYTNYLLLVPGLFFRKKRYKYFIAILSLVFCFYFISDLANKQITSHISRNNVQEQLNRAPASERRLQPVQPPIGRMRRPGFFIPHAHIIGYSLSSLFVVLLSLGLRVLEHQSAIEKMQEEMEKANLNTELAFLKNQISPHFFFNTLNNIYSLVDRNAEDSKKAIVKLSKLMRYIINDSERDRKRLSDEIEFMNNYIDLMKLRIGSKTRLVVNFPDSCNDMLIPPFLFISLIENAFKHGISVQEESFIEINLKCDNKNILFTCVNSLPESLEGTSMGSPGIGLENLKKRLKLLYPDRHKLEIHKTDNKFEADLQIQLMG